MTLPLVSVKNIMSGNCEVEPGAASESILVTTDSCENFEQMSSSLEEIKSSNSVQQDGNDEQLVENSNNIDNYDEVTSNNIENSHDDDVVNSKDWLNKKKHIFVLSSAGKPIYCR